MRAPIESVTVSRDFAEYEDLEGYLFGRVGPEFRNSGTLLPIDFLAILTWKANRARTRHIQRIVHKGYSIGSAAEEIARQLRTEDQPAGRLKVLMTTWGFRLATATAILAVLYENDFTVYDIRVCNQIKVGRNERGGDELPFATGGDEFYALKDRPFSEKLWRDYEAFTEAVRLLSQRNSLRDADKYLWGRDWYVGTRRALRLASFGAIASRLEPTSDRPFALETPPVGVSPRDELLQIVLMPAIINEPIADLVSRLAYEEWSEAVGDFDHMAWSDTSEGRRLLRGEWHEQLSEDDVARTLVALVRRQKMEPAILLNAFQSGLLCRLAKRAAELYDKLVA